MRIGYPCINRSVGCTANSTFRLASYSEERLFSCLRNNLACLSKILQYNLEKGLLFFRISSDLVPLASHPACKSDWASHFREEFREIGSFIKRNGMRISMHPDQFVLINALDGGIVERSVSELDYHAKVLDSLGLDSTAKIQIHAGGVYGDKEAAISRFIQRYARLPPRIKKRLVIENDDRLFSLKDCLSIHRKTGIPVLFDSFHHSLLNNGEGLRDALLLAKKAWKKKDGPLMVDYSTQQEGSRPGTHATHIVSSDFRRFLFHARGIGMDVMLEIKDKEKSALEALAILNSRNGSG